MDPNDPDLFAHYKASLVIPILDRFMPQLKERFELLQKVLSHFSILIPSKIVLVDH